ncbi:MAG: flagellar motor protein MotB [Opitutae bacterium]|nr:flagellar motor protein MotB [Opitutae bacterium]
MKNSMWMIVSIAFAVYFVGCSKSKGPSPEDTALIKGTDRGSFVGSIENSQLSQEGDELSPIGASISGLEGSNELLPQDPLWDDPSFLDNAEKPFEPIFFGFDQYSIGVAERTKLQDINNFMAQNTNARILIEGYCDWKGTPAYNKSLGDRRASSVRDYLVDLGVESSRIEVLSMGDELATPNADPTTAGLERKAQLLVLRDS